MRLSLVRLHSLSVRQHFSDARAAVVSVNEMEVFELVRHIDAPRSDGHGFL